MRQAARRSFACTLGVALTAVALGQDALKPTDNLIVEGIPPIPASVVETVGRYTEFRSASFADWHPVKREILIRTRFGDTTQVHRVATPGGARSQLTFFADNVGGGSHGPTDTDSFVFSKDVGGNEQFQLYRYDLASGQSTLLTDGKSRNTSMAWSTDGRRFLYMSNRRNGADSDLYLIEPDRPASDRMLLQLKGGGWGPVDWSEDDRRAIVRESVSINESYLYLLDLDTAKLTPLTPKGSELVAHGGGFFSKDGKGFFFTSDEGTEFGHLRYRDFASGKTTVLTGDIPWNVEGASLSRDGNRIAFTVNEAGNSALYLMDAKSHRYRKVAGLPPGVVGGVDWHPNSKDLGFVVNSYAAPSDAYSLDVESGKITRWTISELGGLSPDLFVAPKLVRWKSFDGREITGWLRLPPSDKFPGKRPVIIEMHGGPEGQARPTFLGRLNYYINELGVAILEPNVRGSSGFGKTFVKLDNGVLRGDSYKDIGALLDALPLIPEIDPTRVVVSGGSYGGHMSFAIAYVYGDRIAAAMPVVGMSNLVTFLENTADYRRDLRRVEYGDERDPKTREYLLSIAPMNHASKIVKPIFVVQGQNDPRVPFSEAQQFVDKIKGSNANLWYLVAKDEGHGFAKKKNRDFQFYATVLFLKEFVLNGK